MQGLLSGTSNFLDRFGRRCTKRLSYGSAAVEYLIHWLVLLIGLFFVKADEKFLPAVVCLSLFCFPPYFIWGWAREFFGATVSGTNSNPPRIEV
jgi:hypothetical protein